MLGGLRKRTVLLPGLWSFAWEEAVSWHSSWYQSLHFLPICHRCPSSCCPHAESQSGWVCVSPKTFVGPLRGVSWESCSFFYCPTHHWFLQPEVMGTCLPGGGTWGWVVWSGARITGCWGIPPDFYLPHMNVGLPILLPLHATLWLCFSYPCGWIWFL